MCLLGSALAVESSQTGRFELSLPVLADAPTVAQEVKRLGLVMPRQVDRASLTYHLPDERFSVFVPPEHEKGSVFGLLVWIDPTNTPRLSPGWQDVLTQRRMIWISAQNAGNDRKPSQHRDLLAVCAARAIKARYAVDPRRVYVGGVSGGGRTSSRAALAYADEFTGGGLFIVGSMPLRNVTMDDGKILPGYAPRLRKDLSALVKQERHFVHLAGSEDYNRQQMRLVFEQYQDLEFQHSHWLEIAGMGHVYPNAADFGRALDLLDGRTQQKGP